MTKILLVEDDSQIAKSVQLGLNLEHMAVAHADSVAGAWSILQSETFDLILLDVNLPDGDGIQLCARVRAARNEVPIVFISARVDEETVVKGIEAGGDDYIRKPFGMQELKARIRRMTRAPENLGQKIVKVGPMALDVDRRRVTLNERAVTLGRREFDILAILARRAGDVVAREVILQELDEDSHLYDRTIDSHISHLRRKFRQLEGESIQIISIYGVGYRLEWDKV